MEEKSFLPDGSAIRARLLARAPYDADALERIAKGADPAECDGRPSFVPSPAQNGTWGVLYVSDSGAGFYSARSEPSMLGFSLNAGADSPEPIHLRFPADGSPALEIIRTKRLPGKLGALLAKIVAPDDVAVIRWNDTGKPWKIALSVANGDIDAFERAFDAR